MRTQTILMSLALALTTLSGCDDEISKSCKKIANIVEQQGKPSDRMDDAALDKCKAGLEKAKKEEPEEYAAFITCIDEASDLMAVAVCADKGK